MPIKSHNTSALHARISKYEASDIIISSFLFLAITKIQIKSVLLCPSTSGVKKSLGIQFSVPFFDSLLNPQKINFQPKLFYLLHVSLLWIVIKHPHPHFSQE